MRGLAGAARLYSCSVCSSSRSSPSNQLPYRFCADPGATERRRRCRAASAASSPESSSLQRAGGLAVFHEGWGRRREHSSWREHTTLLPPPSRGQDAAQGPAPEPLSRLCRLQGVLGCVMHWRAVAGLRRGRCCLAAWLCCWQCCRCSVGWCSFSRRRPCNRGLQGAGRCAPARALGQRVRGRRPQRLEALQLAGGLRQGVVGRVDRVLDRHVEAQARSKVRSCGGGSAPAAREAAPAADAARPHQQPLLAHQSADVCGGLAGKRDLKGEFRADEGMALHGAVTGGDLTNRGVCLGASSDGGGALWALIALARAEHGSQPQSARRLAVAPHMGPAAGSWRVLRGGDSQLGRQFRASLDTSNSVQKLQREGDAQRQSLLLVVLRSTDCVRPRLQRFSRANSSEYKAGHI